MYDNSTEVLANAPVNAMPGRAGLVMAGRCGRRHLEGGQVMDSHLLTSGYREDVAVRALLTVAARSGNLEQAAFSQGVDSRDLPDEAARIAADHGFGPDRLIAMKGLARSRGVGLEVVLRAALRGDLLSIVRLPTQQTPRREVG